LRDASGAQLVGRVAAFWDCSASVDLERRKHEFLAAITQHLKTPLSSVKGYAQLR